MAEDVELMQPRQFHLIQLKIVLASKLLHESLNSLHKDSSL